MVLLMLFGVGSATALALKAFDQNMMFFYSPTEIKAGKAPDNIDFRIGGVVVPRSVKRSEGSLMVQFDLTDTKEVITVQYSGILPDLFREGQGIIARGQLNDGVIKAVEVLAKHDENYMPPEVADAVAKAKEAY
jgi:cytochrome c-type biogenesis protein CcmE